MTASLNSLHRGALWGLSVSFHPYSNHNSTGGLTGGEAPRGRGSERAVLREGVAGDCLAQGGLVGSGVAGNPDPSSVSLRSLFVA